MARQLAGALRGQALSEAEFRLLWLLSRQVAAGLEQRRLAEELGVSPAQVSATVEKLRCQQLIEPKANNTDRRRQHWQLTPTGQQQFDAIGAEVESLVGNAPAQASAALRWRPSQEDAA